MNAPVQWALSKWLAGRSAIQKQILGRVRTNLAKLDERLSEQRMIERLIVEGGWYATLRIPALRPDEETVRHLIDRGTWVHPGYFFGMPDSGWVVLSLLGPEPEFSAGVTTLVEYLGTNQGGNKI
jgi:alanine-synthesizing transaminase